MTNEVQTFSNATNRNQITREQKRASSKSSFKQSQIMRSSRKISANNPNPPLSEPVTKTDNRISSCSTMQAQQQSTHSKPTTTNRDMMLNSNNNINTKSNNYEDSSLVSQTTFQDLNNNNDKNTIHLNRDTSNACGSDDEADKHHVGPVMGIFFKVWSLVKVTKLRTNQKIRRQNSEDAAQFQYIPGSQFANSATQQQQAQRHSAGGLLEDRHFRRAGSQPAASSSRASDQFAASARYQPLQPAVGQLMADAATGTNSSSSGVSSAASSCLANADSSSAVRRHLSSYSLRRPSPATRLADRSLQLAAGQQQVELNTTSGASSGKGGFNGAKPSGGWAAKIKRSATTVNQTDTSSSRYRFRRSNRLAMIGGLNRDSRLATTSKSEERTSAGSDEALNGIVGDDNEMKTSNGGLVDRGEDFEGQEESGEEDEEEEEEDSNDIYSTPNDSIQSVPMMSNEPTMMMMPQAIAVHQAASQAYPIIKSFSTNNFNQLSRQQTNESAHNSFEQNHHNQHYQQQQQQQKFMQIDEPMAAKNSHPIKHTDRDLFQKQDSSQSGSISRRLNGSRIFISSSSSEDSNHSPANQQQQQLTIQQQDLRHHQAKSLRQTDRQQSGAQLLDQDRPQVPVQLGFHYHAPNAFRPSSLVFGSAADGQVNLVMPISLFTPISNGPAAAQLYHQSAVSPSQAPGSGCLNSLGYRKSPSMMEIVNGGARKMSSSSNLMSHNFGFGRFPSTTKQLINSTFKPIYDPKDITTTSTKTSTKRDSALPNSISLHDCKLSSHKQQPLVSQQNHQFISCSPTTKRESLQEAQLDEEVEEEEMDSEYKLAQMLIEFNSNPRIKDQNGCTALMHAVLSDNLPVLKCLIENGADLNEINQAGFSALDLVCIKEPTTGRLEILKFLIDKRANMDQISERDGTRLLDRLIAQHTLNDDKLPFIECLLQNGAKLGSSTWNAADGKYEIQLRLLEKLCQDGYFLYKQSSIAAAVYRFEYALKRIHELEKQLSIDNCRHQSANLLLAVSKQSISVSVRQIKYQTYLGLSRCERKRKFYKRAMEFAHMAILVDSTSYEGYYSKTHILKDLGEFDDSLKAIEQTSRLVEKSIENLTRELETLNQQEEAMIFDGCFDLLDKRKPSWFGKTRLDLSSNLDYLERAKKFISRLKAEIMDDKLRVQGNGNLDSQKEIFSNSTPIAT